MPSPHDSALKPHPETDRLLEAAREAALAGGEVLMRYFREGVVIRNKSDQGSVPHDLVSDADVESEKRVAEILTRAFPHHQLMGEESLGKTIDPSACDDLWVIDPLDGTTNFLHSLPHFAVSIAYYHRGRAVVGVVHDPARGDWYTAAVGDAARRNGQPVKVCGDRSLSESLIATGFYYDRDEMMRCTLRAIEECFNQQIHGIRRFGAATLDLCMVGCGQLGGFFEYRLSPWDFAAGGLFVELAGGKVSTTRGEPLGLMPSGVVASNGWLHETLVGITTKHHPPAKL